MCIRDRGYGLSRTKEQRHRRATTTPFSARNGRPGRAPKTREECGFEVSVPGAIRNRVPGDGSPFIPAPTDRTRWGIGDVRDRCTNLIPFKWIRIPMRYRTLGAARRARAPQREVSPPISSDYPHGEAATDQRHRAIDATAPERCARVLVG